MGCVAGPSVLPAATEPCNDLRPHALTRPAPPRRLCGCPTPCAGSAPSHRDALRRVLDESRLPRVRGRAGARPQAGRRPLRGRGPPRRSICRAQTARDGRRAGRRRRAALVEVVGTAGSRAGPPGEPGHRLPHRLLDQELTAISVLRLRDAGKLSLDEPAEKYLPELARLRYPTRDSPRITVRHLLSHSAGFPEDNPWGDLQLGMSSEELQRMLSRGLAFSRAPGTAYEYSNTGFALLGRLVERVSGQRIQDYLSENVLRPLRMVATVWRQKDVPVARLALGYGRRTSAPGPQLPGDLREEPQLADGVYAAMGGLYASMRDLARYAAFQLDAWPPRDDPETGPLSRASRREMQQAARHAGLEIAPGDPLRARARGYGYGFGAHESCDFDRIVSHGGGPPGLDRKSTRLNS